MIIEAHITAKEIFNGIRVLSTKEKVIGYLIEAFSKEDAPSIVTVDGKTLGEYCCEEHAVKAAFAHAHGLPEEPAFERSTRTSIADLLLASLLKSMARH